MKNPLITIITVVFNGEKFLEETICSVVNQTYDNIEYIIIDGGSTDGTLDIIRKYEKKIDYWISEKDKGIYDAMNKGIEIATGEWINFMNAGDRFLNPFIIANIRFNNNYLCIHGLGQNENYNNIPNHQSMFIFREWHLNNKYNIMYKICADYEIKIKLLETGLVNFLNLETIYSLPGGISQTLNYCKEYFENAKNIYEIDMKYSTKNKLKIKCTFIFRWVYSKFKCFHKTISHI
jgi:glycosyltransferase involved in cell wall biosynthesis